MSTVTATANTTRIPALRGAADLVGRSLLASLFVISGLGKLAAYAGTAGYMESVGVPGALLPLVIALEVLAAWPSSPATGRGLSPACWRCSRSPARSSSTATWATRSSRSCS